MRRFTQSLVEAVNALAIGTSRLHRLLTTWVIRLLQEPRIKGDRQRGNPEDFARDVERLLSTVLNPAALGELSAQLQAQFKTALLSNPNCMLPSYNHQLPDGTERGKFLALDVGGSTFRVALIELLGSGNDDELRILSLKSYKINKKIKELKGVAFFDWVAGKIEETICSQAHDIGGSVLSMGLAWSFPIQQTSLRSGLMQGMGKGFLAADGLLGQDLGDVLQAACSRRGLNVQLDAIVNDSSATLLSQAYSDPSTRFGLILGTGVNMAVHFPVGLIGQEKFGIRPASWHDAAEHVIVNGELGMFGKGILPMTKWDVELNACHSRPDFQPLEHLVGGRYLGEIARLILVDGIRSANLFGGVVPPSLEEAYTFDTELLANIQFAPTIEEARCLFLAQHPTRNTPSDLDMKTLRLVAHYITKRASAILAAAIHASWQVRNEAEGIVPELAGHSGIACNGSVIQNYPEFRANCQTILDTMVKSSGGKEGSLELMVAVESSLVGAAVAVACIDNEKEG